jgi:hypothetical protein
VRANRRMIGSAMPYAWKEREELAKVERDIVEGERLAAEQVLRIGWMAKRGHVPRRPRSCCATASNPLSSCAGISNSSWMRSYAERDLRLKALFPNSLPE